MKIITVDASKIYDIIIGEDILEKAGSYIKKISRGQTAVIVADDITAGLYLKKLTDTLEKNNYRVGRYIFPHGESSKNTETFISLVNYFAEEKLSRTDIVIALGGGVTGDLAGFAASCYMRGVGFIQIPTTLLAAVDSSVGGKTAVNLDAGKNLLGSFYQPDLVLCDVSALYTLYTLTPEVFKDGCAEVIKYGIIADKKLFESLETPIQTKFQTKLEDIIFKCVTIKKNIITTDEFENNTRRLLNFGHTVGHAIELLSGYKISHGQAVAAGMAIITRAAVRMGMCNIKSLKEILNMLRLYDLPINTPYKADKLALACLSDKKISGDNITMIFPIEIGKCVLKEIPTDKLESVIQLGLEEL